MVSLIIRLIILLSISVVMADQTKVDIKKSIASLFVTQCSFFNNSSKIGPQTDVNLLVKAVYNCIDKVDQFCSTNI